MSDVVGWATHAEAVARLRASYDAIPPGAPVRLAKRTSNLFRARARQPTPRPRRLRAGRRGRGRRRRGRQRTADVQGMCTYEDLVDVTLARGFIPYVVPQLRSITLGGAVTGLGIESTSFRNGLPHESVLEMDVLTGAGEVVTTRPGRGPVRRVPELLRLARLRHPAADPAGAGPARTSTCGTSASTTSTRSPRPSRRSSSSGEHDGRPRRRPGRRGVRAGGGLPDAGHLARATGRRPRRRQRLHRHGPLLPVAASGARPTP